MEALGYCARKRSQADEVRSQKLEHMNRRSKSKAKSQKAKPRTDVDGGRWSKTSARAEERRRDEVERRSQMREARC